MSRVPLVRFENAALKIIDGDRGNNYPQKNEFQNSGHCVFLNAGNVTARGFDFAKVDFISEAKDSLLRKGKASRNDIVLTTRGTVGNVAFYGSTIPFNNMRINSGMVLIRTDHNEIEPYYLYAFLGSAVFQKQVSSNGSGSAQPQLPISALNNIAIPLPKIQIQKKIASVFRALNTKIDCNNRINAELEAMAKTLYDYWFVQYDFPDTNGKPYKSTGGKMVYNSILKRDIPAGWRLSTIGKSFKTYLGGTPSRERGEYWAPGDVNWLSSGENPSTFVVVPDEKISNLGLQNSPAKLLPEGTVVLSIVRHLRASILGIEAATNQSVVGVLETDKIKHCFIYPYIVREIPRLMAIRTGAQQPHINKRVLDESLLVVPDDSTLKSYTSYSAPLFSQIRNYLQQNRELTRLRDWLLPMLMNGQVRAD